MSDSYLSAVRSRQADASQASASSQATTALAGLSDPPGDMVSLSDPPGDMVSLICGQLLTPDLLACASASAALAELCKDTLERNPTLRLRGPEVTGANLLWLARERMHGACRKLDVADCSQLTKAEIAQAIATSPSLEELTAVRCGSGAWSAKQLAKLLAGAPPSLHTAHLDVRLELKNDLHAESPLLTSLAHPAMRCARLVLISDSVSTARHGADGPPPPAAAAAAAAALAAAAAEAEAAAADDVEVVPASEQAEALRRLAGALGTQAPHLLELDAASGALGPAGGATLLLAPLLGAPACALRVLAATSLARGAVRVLAAALRANRSLRTLELGSNLFSAAAAAQLTAALEGHPALTRLGLDHNPILDGAAAALLAALPRTRLESLSLAFTGAADGACAALALALADPRCALRELNLTGNGIGPAGADALGEALGAAADGAERGLTSLNLAANLKMGGQAAGALAKALPASRLRALTLAGCNVDKKGCARLAAALPQSALTSLDLSSNHFADGADELAWVLPSCDALRTLSLADCALGDEEADELTEALVSAPALASLDLRWNRISSGHAVGNDGRVLAAGQKGESAQERRAKDAAAKAEAAGAKGKKVYRPKWQRDMKVTSGGGAA